MKNFLLAIAAIISFTAAAQNFPGEKIDLLTGRELKVLPKETNLHQYGYKNFYTDEKLKKVYKEKKYATPYDELVGKIFKMISFEPYRSANGTLKFKIKIENPETGPLFYDYDPKFTSGFPFEVIGGLVYPEGFFCDLAVEKKSEDDKRKYEFPFIDGVRISFYRKQEFEILLLTINSPVSASIGKDVIIRGVVLTFDNGKTVEFPDEILNVSSNGLGSTILNTIIGFHKYSPNLELFRTSKIVKIKLNKYERDYDEGLTLLEYIKCGTK
jgi:hypothetical protein